MKKIGITGGIGAGKSVISKVFQALGYPVYDADSAAKWCYVNDRQLKYAVVNLFGKETYLINGSLNRNYLAKQVFKNQEKLQQLNAIVHPVVKRHFEHWVKENNQFKLVFKEAAILIETGGYQELDSTILVTAPLNVRLARVMKRDKTNKEEVLNRIDKQWSDNKKRPLANFELVNNDKKPLLEQILEIEKILLQ
jgi:dephospho-CoA kinase